MFRRRAAAAADDVDAVLLDEPFEPIGEFERLEREVRFVAVLLRQPRIRHDAEPTCAGIAEFLNRAEHQIGADRTIESDHVDLGKRLECGERGGNLTDATPTLAIVSRNSPVNRGSRSWIR